MVQRRCLGIVQSVDLLNDAIHAHFEQIQIGYQFFVAVVYNVILTFKRHNFTDQLVS